MKKVKALVLLGLVLIAGCKSTPMVKAYVFERKHLPENRLQLKYRFVYNGQQVTDSASISNQVVKGDSIMVEIDARKGIKSHPVIGK